MSLFGAFSMAVLMVVVILLTLATLIDFWRRGNLEMKTKFALTQFYPLSWLLLSESGWLFLIVQALLTLLLGWMTTRSLRSMNQNDYHPMLPRDGS